MARTRTAERDAPTRDRWIHHPFLLAIFPILSLYSTNLPKLSASNLVRPISIALLVAALLWSALYALERDLQKSAKLTTVLLAGFWGWGVFNFLINDLLFAGFHVRHRYIFPIWCALVLFALWKTYRSKNSTLFTTKALNFGTVALLAIPTFNIVLAIIGPSVSSGTSETVSDLPATPSSIVHSPDIYYVVLDGYGRADVLAEQGYDFRGGLAETLPKLGFFVAEQSVANYPQTLYSLASSLNYEYLHDLIEGFPKDQQNSALLIRLVQENRIVRTLRAYGYEFVSCSTGFHGTENLNADQLISPPAELSEFEFMVLNVTPLQPFSNKFGYGSPYALHRLRIRTCVDALPEIAKNPARTFTLAHIVAPHHPFVFGPNGEERNWSGRTFGLRHDWWRDASDAKKGTLDPGYARGYRDQITFISKLIFETVSRVLENSPEPPIIIVQGDHGPNGFLDPQPEQTRYPILNAYLLPHGGQARLYDSISPVNSFRVVLDHYFDADIDLLPDKRYSTDPSRPDRPGIELSELDSDDRVIR